MLNKDDTKDCLGKSRIASGDAFPRVRLEIGRQH